MTRNTDGNRKSSAQFSLGLLFLFVTVFAGCLAAIQFKFRLRDTDWFADYTRDMIAQLPVSSTLLLFLIQIVTLGIAALALVLWRQPSLLWLYAASHTLWLLSAATCFLLQPHVSLSNLISEVWIMFYFCETTCAIVFAGLAFFQSLMQRIAVRVLAAALIFVLSLLAELCAVVELDAFASALAAALAFSR